MSKLSRPHVILAKAIDVMNSVEQNSSDNQPLTIGSDLTLLLREIPTKKLGQLCDKRGKLTPEWETIATVARTVSLAALDEKKVDTVHDYLPSPTEFHFENFQRRWSELLSDNSKDVHDFLGLLESRPLHFCV
jgi:hypothetical protein